MSDIWLYIQTNWLRLLPAVIGFAFPVILFTWFYIRFESSSLKKVGLLLESVQGTLQLENSKFKKNDDTVVLEGMIDERKITIKLERNDRHCSVTIERPDEQFDGSLKLTPGRKGFKKKYGNRGLDSKWKTKDDADRGIHVGEDYWIIGDKEDMADYRKTISSFSDGTLRSMLKRMKLLEIRTFSANYVFSISKKLKTFNEKQILELVQFGTESVVYFE